jgi:hypothetical protein
VLTFFSSRNSGICNTLANWQAKHFNAESAKGGRKVRKEKKKKRPLKAKWTSRAESPISENQDLQVSLRLSASSLCDLCVKHSMAYRWLALIAVTTIRLKRYGDFHFRHFIGLVLGEQPSAKMQESFPLAGWHDPTSPRYNARQLEPGHTSLKSLQQSAP